MRYIVVLILVFCTMAPNGAMAQNNFDDFKRKVENNFSSFKNTKEKEFEDFRNRANAEFAALLEQSWKSFNAFQGIPKPKVVPPVPPVVYPEDDNKKPLDNTPKPIEEVIPIVKPEPQPEPISPIKETPRPPVESYHTFVFFNTSLRVRLNEKHRFTMRGSDEKEVARIWNILSDVKYNHVITDCLNIRSQHKLCDWAYLLMLNDLSNSFFSKGSNESVMLTAFLYCQSGYKMRLAEANNFLFLLYASNHAIYDKPYWDIDGEMFYALDCNYQQLHICQAEFPNERALSLQIPTEQLFTIQASQKRNLQSKRFQEIKVLINTNENLIRFYDTYPTSIINGDFGTRWAMYANTPLSKQAQNTLYPTLKQTIMDISQYEAVNKLLNFVQTAFVYKLDDEVWGGDRAFFPDETLYYPYCDCEDRSILFSRIVRDLLGLDVVLIYYPGHLATAVHFDENVRGDYILINGNRYVICDPTYIGAPVGATMPQMDNAKAKVILLE